jgi:hypothetical protein
LQFYSKADLANDLCGSANEKQKIYEQNRKIFVVFLEGIAVGPWSPKDSLIEKGSKANIGNKTKGPIFTCC